LAGNDDFVTCGHCGTPLVRNLETGRWAIRPAATARLPASATGGLGLGIAAFAALCFSLLLVHTGSMPRDWPGLSGLLGFAAVVVSSVGIASSRRAGRPITVAVMGIIVGTIPALFAIAALIMGAVLG